MNNYNSFHNPDIWHKDCNCYSTSSTARTVLTTEHKDDGIVTTVTFYPQPVCDKCDKAWVLGKAETIDK